MLDQVLDVDPTNNKAWQRKIQNLISISDVEEAAKTIQKAEKYAIVESDKVQLRQFKSKIQDSNNKEKEFSQKIFGSQSKGLYEDKPVSSSEPKVPTPDELNKAENEMLPTLSNLEWLMYPFVKTFRVLSQRLCGRKGKDGKDD